MTRNGLGGGMEDRLGDRLVGGMEDRLGDRLVGSMLKCFM